MRKIVAAVILSLFLLCGCSRAAAGNVSELTEYRWQANTDGGGSACLFFDGDYATLSLSNGEESLEISGRYLADGESLVIFDDALKQNYAFDYVPMGEKLQLSYDGGSIEMKAVK